MECPPTHSCTNFKKKKTHTFSVFPYGKLNQVALDDWGIYYSISLCFIGTPGGDLELPDSTAVGIKYRTWSTGQAWDFLSFFHSQGEEGPWAWEGAVLLSVSCQISSSSGNTSELISKGLELKQYQAGKSSGLRCSDCLLSLYLCCNCPKQMQVQTPLADDAAAEALLALLESRWYAINQTLLNQNESFNQCDSQLLCLQCLPPSPSFCERRHRCTVPLNQFWVLFSSLEETWGRYFMGNDFLAPSIPVWSAAAAPCCPRLPLGGAHSDLSASLGAFRCGSGHRVLLLFVIHTSNLPAWLSKCPFTQAAAGVWAVWNTDGTFPFTLLLGLSALLSTAMASGTTGFYGPKLKMQGGRIVKFLPWFFFFLCVEWDELLQLSWSFHSWGKWCPVFLMLRVSWREVLSNDSVAVCTDFLS